MMETIRRILEALDAVDSAGLEITVFEDLYPTRCLEEARSAFAELCVVEIRDQPTGALALRFLTLPTDPIVARRTVGEFLNYALQCSLRSRPLAATPTR
jgi:hypothetical protein